jgi:hypothetical protein
MHRPLCLVLVLVLSACTSYGQLKPGPAPEGQLDDAWLALALNTTPRIDSLEICPAKENGACLTAGPWRQDGDVQLLFLEAGKWCITRMAFADGGARDDAHICMAVAAGQLNYPGTFQFSPVEKVTNATDLQVARVDAYSSAKIKLMREFPWLTAVKWQPGPLPPHAND